MGQAFMLQYCSPTITSGGLQGATRQVHLPLVPVGKILTRGPYRGGSHPGQNFFPCTRPMVSGGGPLYNAFPADANVALGQRGGLFATIFLVERATPQKQGPKSLPWSVNFHTLKKPPRPEQIRVFSSARTKNTAAGRSDRGA